MLELTFKMNITMKQHILREDSLFFRPQKCNFCEYLMEINFPFYMVAIEPGNEYAFLFNLQQTSLLFHISFYIPNITDFKFMGQLCNVLETFLFGASEKFLMFSFANAFCKVCSWLFLLNQKVCPFFEGVGFTLLHVGSLFLDQGSNKYPLQWKQAVLTIGPPEKPWDVVPNSSSLTP